MTMQLHLWSYLPPVEAQSDRCRKPATIIDFVLALLLERDQTSWIHGQLYNSTNMWSLILYFCKNAKRVVYQTCKSLSVYNNWMNPLRWTRHVKPLSKRRKSRIKKRNPQNQNLWASSASLPCCRSQCCWISWQQIQRHETFFFTTLWTS